MPVNAYDEDCCAGIGAPIETRWYHEHCLALSRPWRGKGFLFYLAKDCFSTTVGFPGGDMIEQEKTSLPRAYEPQAVEGKWYRFWEEHGYFKPRSETANKPTFV